MATEDHDFKEVNHIHLFGKKVEWKSNSMLENNNHSNIMLEYVEFIELKNMRPIKDFKAKGQNAICIAIYIDGIRLIDNIIL